MGNQHRDPEWLREKYHDEGLTQEEIAELAGVSQGTIWHHMDKNDIERRDYSEIYSQFPEDEPYADEGWLQEKYHGEGKTLPQMADVADVSVSTITRYMDLYGIERRGQSEAQRPDGKHTDEEWLREQYVDKRLSMAEIGEKLGMTASGIKKWIHRFDIPVRKSYEHTRYQPAQFRTHRDGYERVRAKCNYKQDRAGVHQLVAIADGANPSKVFSNGRYHVHHENRIPWDNRPENLTLKSRITHATEHQTPEDRHTPDDYATESNKEELLTHLRQLVCDWRDVDNSTIEMCADELDGLLRDC